MHWSTSLCISKYINGERCLPVRAIFSPAFYFPNYSISITVTAGQDREKFERLRWVELKHGRIAMLAVVGKSREREGELCNHLQVMCICLSTVRLFFQPTTDMTWLSVITCIKILHAQWLIIHQLHTTCNRLPRHVRRNSLPRR